MHLIIKTFSVIAIFCCCSICAVAQGFEVPQNQYANDPCGNPAVESMAWTSVEGKVVKVIDGDTIIISLDSKKRLLVHLVGIDAPALNQPFGREAQQFLERSVGAKRLRFGSIPVVGYTNDHGLERLLVSCTFGMQICRMPIFI